jgi:hypothetical protein
MTCPVTCEAPSEQRKTTTSSGSHQRPSGTTLRCYQYLRLPPSRPKATAVARPIPDAPPPPRTAHARRGAAHRCRFRQAAGVVGRARSVKDLSFRSGFHLYPKGYACVSSRSNIAEANVTPCPSMFLIDALPFWLFPIWRPYRFVVIGMEQMRFAAHPRTA